MNVEVATIPEMRDRLMRCHIVPEPRAHAFARAIK